MYIVAVNSISINNAYPQALFSFVTLISLDFWSMLKLALLIYIVPSKLLFDVVGSSLDLMVYICIRIDILLDNF